MTKHLEKQANNKFWFKYLYAPNIIVEKKIPNISNIPVCIHECTCAACACISACVYGTCGPFLGPLMGQAHWVQYKCNRIRVDLVKFVFGQTPIKGIQLM